MTAETELTAPAEPEVSGTETTQDPIPAAAWPDMRNEILTAWASALPGWESGRCEAVFTDPGTGRAFTLTIDRVMDPSSRLDQAARLRARNAALILTSQDNPADYQRHHERLLAEQQPEPARRR